MEILRRQRNQLNRLITQKINIPLKSLPSPKEDTEEDSVTVEPLSSAMTAEDYRPDSISLVTYLRYFWAGGMPATLLMLVLSVLSNAGLLLAYLWLQSISDCALTLYANSSVGMINATNSSVGMYNTTCPWYYDYNNPGAIWLLALFTFSGSLFTLIRGFNFYYVVLQAGRRLHNRMLRRLVHTPLHFFDTNPSGRILNRFSKDIGFMDVQLPMQFYDFWQYSTFNAAVIIATCLLQYYLIIPFAILLVSMLALRYYYLRTSSQIKRLESVARSPLYSHISLTLQGLSTIRALGIGERITQDMYMLQDQHACTWYNYTSCHRWFGIRLDLMAAFVIIIAIFSSFFSRCVFSSDVMVGFSLPLLLSLSATFQYMVRQSGEVEILMVSVDRVLNYCKLAQELVFVSPLSDSTFVSSSNNAAIEYKNFYFKYSENLPYTLSDVSLSIRSGERIGIVGRTGAGKSSLFNSLLRIKSHQQW